MRDAARTAGRCLLLVTSDGETLIHTTWASGDAQIAAIAMKDLDLTPAVEGE